MREPHLIDPEIDESERILKCKMLCFFSKIYRRKSKKNQINSKSQSKGSEVGWKKLREALGPSTSIKLQ